MSATLVFSLPTGAQLLSDQLQARAQSCSWQQESWVALMWCHERVSMSRSSAICQDHAACRATSE
jgi:hypothetical protein